MIALGTDIEEIARIKSSIKNPRFLTRVFSSAEIAFFEERGMPVSTIAGTFCAKEAFSKALGTGFRGFSMRDVSVLRDSLGKPYFVLSGAAARLAQEKRLCFTVSISHSREYALAVVAAEPMTQDV